MHRVCGKERKVLNKTKHVKLDETIFPAKTPSRHVQEHDLERDDELKLGNLDSLISVSGEKSSIEQ